MQLYGGIDLHSNNNFLAIADTEDKRVYQKRLLNEPDVVLAELAPFQKKHSRYYGGVDIQLVLAGGCTDG